jgi:hypothetical protein
MLNFQTYALKFRTAELKFGGGSLDLTAQLGNEINADNIDMYKSFKTFIYVKVYIRMKGGP